MNMDLGTNVQASDLFDAMKQSPVMKQKGYELLYDTAYTVHHGEMDGYGLCYLDETNCKTYIHVRIHGHGTVSSFEYHTTLDANKTADNDMNDLLKELKQKFP